MVSFIQVHGKETVWLFSDGRERKYYDENYYFNSYYEFEVQKSEANFRRVSLVSFQFFGTFELILVD